jgi:hypothetical protein
VTVPRLVWACAARVSVKLRQASSLYRVFSYLPVLSLEPRGACPVYSRRGQTSQALPGCLRLLLVPSVIA